MSRVTRGFGPPSDVQGASASTLSAIDVAAQKTAFLNEAKKFVASYLDALPSQRGAVLSNSPLGQTMDDFVIACSNGKTKLPQGVDALDIIGPAVAEFIKLGIPYSIDIPGMHGPRSGHHSAHKLNAEGLPDWQSIVMR